MEKAAALRASRPLLWDILENVELPIYSFVKHKEYKFISKNPKEDSASIAKKLTKASPYVTINSYVFGNENIISVDNDKVAYVYYSKFDDLDLLREFNLSKNMYMPEYFLEQIKGGKNKHKKTNQKKIVIKKSSEIADKYFQSCKYLFARSGNYVTSTNVWDIAKELKKKFDKVRYGEVRYDISKEYMFEDFRLKRITFVNSKGPFLYLFNNLEYEAVPVINSELHPFVVYRYKLYSALVDGSSPPLDEKNEPALPEEYIGNYFSEKTAKFKLGGFLSRMPLN